MKTSELDFELPAELIAVKPANPRDAAKLLVMDRKNGSLTETNFSHLDQYLNSGDLLVFNETKVFPARIYGEKESGGRVEIVFLAEVEPKKWEVILGGKVKVGQKISLPGGVEVEVTEKGERTIVHIPFEKEALFDYLKKNGLVPLPPYIKRTASPKDKEYYQTVFAKKTGSAAAPTASLHFTKRLLNKLEKGGVETAYVTLHVGLGTFAPVKTEKLEDHPIHKEWFEGSKEVIQKIIKAKKEGRRVIAVGTTVVRTLESLNLEAGNQSGKTKLFIYPGYKFKVVDGVITNFHTPRSSLLGLVFAFAGIAQTKKAYQFAIRKKYRFFSYGDGMLIL